MWLSTVMSLVPLSFKVSCVMCRYTLWCPGCQWHLVSVFYWCTWSHPQCQWHMSVSSMVMSTMMSSVVMLTVVRCRCFCGRCLHCLCLQYHTFVLVCLCLCLCLCLKIAITMIINGEFPTTTTGNKMHTKACQDQKMR